MTAQAQSDDFSLSGILDAGERIFGRWMDYERFDRSADLTYMAGQQNLQARGASMMPAGSGGIGVPTMLLIGGGLILVLLLVRR